METNEELRAKYNPEGSDLRRAQLRMLDMLLYLDKVCKENEITYWLAAGTCLGAVRHGGFIPWDDDIDIFMMENEYKKLIDLILSNPHPQFKIQIKKRIQTISFHGQNYVTLILKI
ncbi:LicD family protein [Bacteroides thetaiotaomicron]|nr:LicD family protein [Bacteroides thetaiotaomicron]